MEISLIEWAMYGIIGYSGIVLLLISAFINPPMTRSQTLTRSLYLMLSIIACFMLANTNINVTTENYETTTSQQYYDSSGSQIILLNGTSHTTSQYTHAIDSQWIAIHSLMGIMMTFYVVTQLFTLLTSKN